jgi:hypothetical protein
VTRRKGYMYSVPTANAPGAGQPADRTDDHGRFDLVPDGLRSRREVGAGGSSRCTSPFITGDTSSPVRDPELSDAVLLPRLPTRQTARPAPCSTQPVIHSQPGLGPTPSARVLAEFDDDPHRCANAMTRKNYARTSPTVRASGRNKVVTARYVRNDRLIDALIAQAFSALRISAGARAHYERHRARCIEFNAALRQLANRLVGILHDCPKTGTPYDEETAWSHRVHALAA